MKYLKICVLGLITICIVGCDSGPESPRGFSLPKGDIDKGKAIFFKFECLTCHQLKGIEQPDLVKHSELSVRLGGKTTQIKTYAELVTSVINPSHKFARGYRHDLIQQDGQSKMKNFNDIMTVAELVDLVAFLQSNYELIPMTRTNYQRYVN